MIDDWADRSLCPDGACTGVIGGDGRCKVCGRVAPFWGDERRRGTVAVSDDDAAPVDAGEPAEGDDDERALCPDGDCTGLLGDDGRCKVCGKAGVRARARAAAGAAPVVRVVPPAVTDDDSDDRRLCPDGSCTGLLDASGVCKVCGQSAEAN